MRSPNIKLFPQTREPWTNLSKTKMQTGVDKEEQCLPFQSTKDGAAIKPSVTGTTPPVVHPEGIQDGEKPDTGPR